MHYDAPDCRPQLLTFLVLFSPHLVALKAAEVHYIVTTLIMLRFRARNFFKADFTRHAY